METKRVMRVIAIGGLFIIAVLAIAAAVILLLTGVNGDKCEVCRPAYDSGWVSVDHGGRADLAHNLGGNVDNYIVDLQFQGTGGINNTAYGSRCDYDAWKGASWGALDRDSIVVWRWEHDEYAEQIRIRIWVYE